MPSYSHHYPAEGTSHADQASREPAKCRAGRTPAGRQQDVMPAVPMPPSWSNKCRVDDGQLPVNLPASPWQSAGRAGQFTPKITRSIVTILPEIRRRIMSRHPPSKRQISPTDKLHAGPSGRLFSNATQKNNNICQLKLPANTIHCACCNTPKTFSSTTNTKLLKMRSEFDVN